MNERQRVNLQPVTEDLVTVSGSLNVGQTVELTRGAVATVKVVDTDGQVLAATAVSVDQLPVQWSTHFDRTLTSGPDRLLVWAMLRSDAGVWGTAELARVTDEEIVLTRIRS